MALEFPSSPTNGQVFDDYFWDASIGAWRGIGSPNNLGVQVAALQTADATTNRAGLVPVVPSSVNVGSGSATVGTNGIVTFTNVNSVTLNGVFTANYRNYVVRYNATASTSVGWNANLATGGTAYTANQHYRAIMYSAGYLRQITGSIGVDPGAATGYVWGDIELFRPQLADFTRAYVFTGGLNGETATINTMTTSNWVNVNNQFDGIQISVSAGSASGTIQVYGYR